MKAKHTLQSARTSLETLAGLYDFFLIDQFGVLHDGQTAYPGANEALHWLKMQGKKIVLLSNSGKRSERNVARLLSLGFERDRFDLFLTSGEIAWTMLSQGLVASGAKCLLLARDNDVSAISGLHLAVAQDGGDADVILLTGSRGDEVALEHYEKLLTRAAKRRVSCICTNPDKLMLTASGLCFGSGAIADLYQKLGGPVTWIGKPYPAIYQAALEFLGNPAPATVCCIGDSLEHDIAGGRDAGLNTVLTRTGIHAQLSEEALESLCRTHQTRPDHVICAFRRSR